MKNLASLTDEELEIFFSSFNTVLSDVDGVLQNFLEHIPGASDAVKALKKLNKRFFLVTNNTTTPLDAFSKRLKQTDFDIKPNEIVIPTHAMVYYLRKQNFRGKKIFVIGSPALKKALKESNFALAEDTPQYINSIKEFITISSADDENVGAVIVDLDTNVNFVALQKAATFLKRRDVLFMSGASDHMGPLGMNKFFMGPGCFIDMLKNATNRENVPMGKPSPYLRDYIATTYKIKDPSKVLFIGDSIPEDMAFAALCGYKKLLVLSGISNMGLLDNWAYPEDYRPDYYAESLKVVYDSITRIYDLENSCKFCDLDLIFSKLNKST